MKAIFTTNWLTSSRAQWLTSAEDHSRFLLSYKVIWSISLPFGWRSRKFQVNDNPEFLYFLFVISRELTEALRSRCSRTQRGNQACPWKRKVGGGIERAHKEVANSGTPSREALCCPRFITNYSAYMCIYILFQRKIWFVMVHYMVSVLSLPAYQPGSVLLSAWGGTGTPNTPFHILLTLASTPHHSSWWRFLRLVRAFFFLLWWV